jgi:uncharacterized lipoprotein YbaY/heat shock protein HslJ
MPSRFLLILGLALISACTTGTPEPATASITGTATYRERMMLPPTAVLEVSLEDVSRADAPADVMARSEVKTTTAPPYSFTVSYDPARIVAGHRYNVRARILDNGTMMFQSDAGYAVLGAGNVTHVDILLKRASPDTRNASSNAQQLRGLYSYLADAGWFVDCRSGVRLAVAQEGDNAALQVAFIKARDMAGAQLLATVEGRVEDRTPMEGSGTQPTLIVEKFVSVEPQGCSGPASTAQLENTYWKVMTLNGKRVVTPDGAREIHFVLTSENRRMRGFGGCNGLSGGYEIDGDRIKFINIARTLMACTHDMVTETEFHEMFPRATGWKVTGEVLQLTDATGDVIAAFESRYMK